MRTEVISIGTELLLGQILNTNAHYLGQELASLGIDCHFQTTVGDNIDRIHNALEIAMNRADLIIATGGLGPTSDDLTHEAIASYCGTQMELDPVVADRIKSLFESRNSYMAKSNLKQAQRPIGSALLPNPIGTAPGIIWELRPDTYSKLGLTETKTLMTFPGVPTEMKRMWEDTGLPYLVNRLGAGKHKLYLKELKFCGIGESALAELVQDLLNGYNPTVAPLAGEGECRLRIACKASGTDEATRMIDAAEQEIRRRAGRYIYGTDRDTLEKVLGETLKLRGFTIAAAESCTGGLIAKRLTDVPGSSQYLSLSVVTYSNESKTSLLDVPAKLIALHGAVSREVAEAMATGIKRLAGSTVGLGVTGIAGPEGGSVDKPIGLVHLACALPDGTVHHRELRLGNCGRSEVRLRTVQEVLSWLLVLLQSA